MINEIIKKNAIKFGVISALFSVFTSTTMYVIDLGLFVNMWIGFGMIGVYLIIAITLLWRGKHYGIRMFFPQIKTPSRQEVNDEIQQVYPGAKVVFHSISEFTPGQPLIQAGFQGGNAGKLGFNKNYVKPMGEEVEVNEDWQKVNRQDKTDGLSPAAVKAYRRENPGSKLQTAVTEKNPTGKRANRRKSFCKRMSGMKSKLTSTKTARDPDSRINKALRRWNCN